MKPPTTPETLERAVSCTIREQPLGGLAYRCPHVTDNETGSVVGVFEPVPDNGVTHWDICGDCDCKVDCYEASLETLPGCPDCGAVDCERALDCDQECSAPCGADSVMCLKCGRLNCGTLEINHE